MFKPKNFFNLSNISYPDLFLPDEEIWNSLKRLNKFIEERLQSNISSLPLGVLPKTCILYDGKLIDRDFHLNRSNGTTQVVIDHKVCPEATILYAGSVFADHQVSIGSGCVVEPGAMIIGPSIIGNFTEIRQGAYIRGDVLIGDHCVVGHTTGVKHSILLGKSKAGHFAYIGDSILGAVNLGAGTKLANLKIFPSSVIVNAEGKRYDTGLRKLGAILGDGVEIGCNSVTTPGTIVSPNVLVYPNCTLRGYYPPSLIVKIKLEEKIIKRVKFK